MGLLTTNCWWSKSELRWSDSSFMSKRFVAFSNPQFTPAKTHNGFRFRLIALAVKKLKRNRQTSRTGTPQSEKNLSNESNSEHGASSEDDYVEDDNKVYFSDDLAAQGSENIPSRSSVLQACTVTSGLLAALGVLIRQVSHIASIEGLPIFDCSAAVPVGFEIWHLVLIAELVVLVSSCRYALLKTWPDFAESSEAANQQVLTSLQPLDYMVVAFLPGVSEELLFRGALLPLFGINWKSVLVVASIFGFLHLGNGRKYSFAVWATFVGAVYGYATIISSSIVVPMASHALNNLVGGMLWRFTHPKELE